jgi:hypothetical protein
LALFVYGFFASWFWYLGTLDVDLTAKSINKI